MNNDYVGQSAQISGVEEVVLAKGRGKGMTLLQVRNGKGLEFTLSADRAMDISRASLDGVNLGWFSSCGYVSPQYYDDKRGGFLKSFTGGFLTTCGLCAVGTPCTDDGEELPLHGTISNTPCENYSYFETENEIVIDATIMDAMVFRNRLLLVRRFTSSKLENTLKIEDCIKNIGNKETPCMLLYHFNMGYPLLSENAKVVIPSNSVKSRTPHAESDIENRLKMEVPQPDYQEMCYFYDVKANDGMASVGIFNPDVKKGLKMTYDKSTLDYFTEWKMMRSGEYVLGLEPANCTPDGRAVMREEGTLKFISPGGEYKTMIKLEFIDSEDKIKCL